MKPDIRDLQDLQQVRFAVEGAICTVELDRPEIRNPLSRRTLLELDYCFRSADDDHDVRAIVLLGAGEHFSAGHDLGSEPERRDREQFGFPSSLPERNAYLWELNVANHLRWRDLGTPTIVGVQGFCIFAASALLAPMDVVFAADDAQFLPEFTQHFGLLGSVDDRKIKEILFEARFVGASEALELGMINSVVPRADLRREVYDYASRVAENDPFQLKMIKRTINSAADQRGYRTAMETAFANWQLAHEHFLVQNDGRQPIDERSGRPRYNRAQRAFDRLERGS